MSTRVLHVTDSFLPKVGGAEQAIDRLVRALAANGCPSSVLSQVNRGVGTAVDVPYDVRRYSRPRASLWAGWWIGRAMANIERELGEFDAYVGHHAFPPGYAAVEYAHARGKAAVIHVRGGDIYRGSRLRAKAGAWAKLTGALRDADAVVALSSAMRDLVLEIAPSARVDVIPNGIDVASIGADASGSRFVGDDRLRGPFILGLGRTIRRKGFHLLVEGFAEVAPMGWKLVIAGDGKDLGDLKTLAAHSRVAGQIVFAGLVSGADKRWLLQNCRFSCAPSLEESFPNVALEALAAGKPVLGSMAGGFADLVTEGRNGLLVPVGEAAALAEGLRHLTTADLAEMSAAALEVARRFDWTFVGARYADLVRRVVAEHRNE